MAVILRNDACQVDAYKQHTSSFSLPSNLHRRSRRPKELSSRRTHLCQIEQIKDEMTSTNNKASDNDMIPNPDTMSDTLGEDVTTSSDDNTAFVVDASLHDNTCASSYASSGPTTGSQLHALAPEFRNMVYRYVLVETTSMEIGAGLTRPAQPGLLQVDRQTRREVSSTYYAENRFSLHIEECEVSDYIKWCKSSEQRFDIEALFCSDCLRSSLNLSHSLVWIKAWYDC
ncbi:hypothetical protein LTR56_005059 [Elasticomyces elasticus]|nr:hypothetical protein LTR56_005059 [Elasticomyces elasticus]KAK3655881.1 hypothetical protein LTR22_010039 [Elasticomyces elasticus]KAK4912608.1 hypothetical protein LTR49_018970 [Elasticomyces elasticus]KAK5752084.1 hypothetical protein LTS12_017847 [Elasticomyces elasticus]